MIQEARKTSGFDVSDRIALRWAADGETADALVEHASTVADEVLATAGRAGSRTATLGTAAFTDADLGLQITLERV